MRLLVCEFITGGGLLGTILPASLVREGELMLGRVLQDLSDCDEVEHIDVLRDPRLPAPIIDKCVMIPVTLDFWRNFAHFCDHVDGVLPIAPETDDVLLHLTQLITQRRGRLLNSGVEAVRLAGSKLQTVDRLQAHGIPVVPTYCTGQAPLKQHDRWVVKPDKGVGGDGCRLCAADEADWPAGHVLQPFFPGTAASMILLCGNGRAVLVACNEQRVQLDRQGCRLQALQVNGLIQHHAWMQSLASAVAAAIPDLWGWVGVDLILTQEGPRVLEVNPRLTTSYTGLCHSLNANPARWLLDLMNTGQPPVVDTAAVRPIDIVP